MIYQCYFHPSQRAAIFGSPPYVGFGLEPEVNAGIDRNCPELADLAVRRTLSEYGCFLHIWRNIEDYPDAWFGFTSHRQLDKNKFRFESCQAVEEALLDCDIVGWGFLDLTPVNHMAKLIGSRIAGPALQAETSHPGITIFLERLFYAHRQRIPDEYYSADKALFANYWVMRRSLFIDFMTWSWPLIRHGLTINHAFKHQGDHPGSEGDRAMGYVMERLFIIWYQMRRLTLKDVEPGSFSCKAREA